MQLSGNSGDKVYLEGDTVLKVCFTDQERFLKNIRKQRYSTSKFIMPVPIIEQGIKDGKNFIRMPYIKTKQPGEDEFNIIFKYLSESFTRCDLMSFNGKIWSEKINDLQTKLVDNKIIRILENIKHTKFTNKIAYGTNHGDLSFDNLLFSDGKIYAIDYLECFMNTPLLDICKLRQSSKHNWSNKAYMLRGFDKLIELAINSNQMIKEYYTPFQILNLCRVLPYTKDEKIIRNLKREILGLNNSYSSSRGKK